MLAVDFLDGNVADWNSSRDDRCLCDVEAVIVYRLAMSRSEFEAGLARLDRRRSARAEYVRRRLVGSRLRGGVKDSGLGVVDAESAFEINDEFEEMFGREPLEAFVVDTEEVVHRCLGDFYRGVARMGATLSPMNAGRAFRILPGRSFQSAASMMAHQKGKKTKWIPSVRTEVKFVVAGDVGVIASAMAGFVSAMAECGVVTRLEQSMRKPDLAGIPHLRPMLAEVGGDRPAEAGEM